jgi:Putative restriction endonuclease
VDQLTRDWTKIGEFLECGVPLVWLVDPARETVTVYRSLSQTEQYGLQNTIHGEPVLPGFSCPVIRFSVKTALKPGVSFMLVGREFIFSRHNNHRNQRRGQ